MKKKPAPARVSRKGGFSFSALLAAVFVLAALLAVLLLILLHAAPPEKMPPAPHKAESNPDAGAAVISPPAEPEPPAALQLPLRRIAIIIDDIGLRREPVEKLLAAGIPLTFSVMPDQPHTKELAATIAAAGQEVMLHLPMEPEDDKENNPGAGALLVTEPDEDIRAAIGHDLGQVPQAKGVNNHMGSLFTQNARKMEVVLLELKTRNLFFIDSRTAPASVGYALARRLGLKTAVRRVFLDSGPDAEAIAGNLRLALALAVKEGTVVAIGHPYPATVAAIESLKDDLAKAGVTPVFASQVVR